MSILNVNNISYGFGDRTLFKDISFRLLRGEHVGLVGKNGEGKSTFMNIITSQLIPDSGDIQWSSKVRVGYMDQHTKLEKGSTIKDILRESFNELFDMESEMNSIYSKMGEMNEHEINKSLEKVANIQDFLNNNEFYNIDSKIDSIALGLGFRHIGLDRDVSELSGGQRTKVLLGKLLLDEPDILLLDEPTNYLDEEHIEWLRKYLQNYENAFILISHDLEFLNSVVNVVCHLENMSLTRYIGNYENFQKMYEENKRNLRIAQEKQIREISKLEEYIAKNKVRASTSKMAKSRQKKLDKIERISISKEKVRPHFDFKISKKSGKMIFEAKNLVIGYEVALSKPINLIMERGEKIALIGANGIGKSTLLKSLIGINKPISGSIEVGEEQNTGYFEQEAKEISDKKLIDEVWYEFPRCTRYEIRKMLSRCGLTNQHIESKFSILSGGEQAKVRLCKLINNPSNILILDEPTNHLDSEAKEELKKALISYEGSIILVCHEPEFYTDIVNKIWDCEKWAINYLI